jgi:hypothetical protein
MWARVRPSPYLDIRAGRLKTRRGDGRMRTTLITESPACMSLISTLFWTCDRSQTCSSRWWKGVVIVWCSAHNGAGCASPLACFNAACSYRSRNHESVIATPPSSFTVLRHHASRQRKLYCPPCACQGTQLLGVY